MNIVSACFIACLATSAPDAKSEYSALSDQLAQEVLWIDTEGSSLISDRTAQKKLKQLIKDLHNPTFRSHHQSRWKNDQSYQIINIRDQKSAYRLFFYCTKIGANRVSVTKIKVDRLSSKST